MKSKSKLTTRQLRQAAVHGLTMPMPAVPLPKPVIPEVVKLLETLLERARTGDIVGIAIATVEHDEKVGSHSASNGMVRTLNHLRGAIGRLDKNYHAALEPKT